ncbi:hypothetical protein MY04_4809 [Flammeovirga sp. MY04]|uniref:hypothetical protein n=1 Tax=Flammeovirga sp. MY04 TaxID=1191459 RepID=UPI0008060EE1|nr:hypothetical protein [Flammeovirga sp. MY04]ANQ49626.1 hypothetical protein MY04_2252 [Flammeovirga sp. MY04]ANQ52144.1 hypothetical protein MY04_4809 [Flammeovirga sp. MY04]
MKKFNTPSKGAIYNTKDFEHLFNVAKDIAGALSSVLTESTAPVRISGVEFTKNGQDYSCTEGWLLHNNTFYKVDAFSGTATGSQIPVFNLETVSEPHEPHDLYEGYNKVGTFFICQEEKLKPSFGASGTGLFDYDAIIKHPVKRNSDAIAGVQGLLRGMVVDYYGDLTNFDATGLGIGEFIGYALCNGQNGTPDARGRVFVGMSDTSSANGNPDANLGEYFVIGNTGGNRSSSLIEGNLPPHKHGVGVIIVEDGDHVHPITWPNTQGDNNLVHGMSARLNSNDNNGEPTALDSVPTQTDLAGKHSHGATVSENTVGNGDPIDIRQPYMVTGKLMKL